jgi:chromosome segregation ATPase
VQAVEQNEKLIKVAREKFMEKSRALKQTLAEYDTYKTETKAKISKLEGDLGNAQTALASTQKQLAATSARLKTVESEKDELTATMDRLKKDIDNYNAQIGDLKAKLQTETKDKEFLMAQVKDLEAKRAELEKKWNDLAQLRKQVRTLVTAVHVQQREQLAQKRGYFGAFQKDGLRNFKTYNEIQQEKTSGATTIEVYRDGNNPPPKSPAPAPAPAPPAAPQQPNAPQPKVLQPGQQPQPPR